MRNIFIEDLKNRLEYNLVDMVFDNKFVLKVDINEYLVSIGIVIIYIYLFIVDL